MLFFNGQMEYYTNDSFWFSATSPVVDFLGDFDTFSTQIELNLSPDEDPDAWIPVDVSFIKEFWLPDAEILNLKVPEGNFVCSCYLLVDISILVSSGI